MQQDALFDNAEPPAPRRPVPKVRPMQPTPALQALAARLHARWGGRLHLGTSSWYFPGWKGLVWHGVYGQPELSKHGLTAYTQHPLLRTVSLDRAFYRPLEAATYASLAAQTIDGFKFVVKAPSAVTDATLRDEGSGAALRPNPLFLDPQAAVDLYVAPAIAGLRDKLGVLLFQISPLPQRWLDNPDLLTRMEALWQAVMPTLPAGVLVALEVRDAGLLTPALAASLRAHGVRFGLGLHDRMPAIEEQLPMLRALWPGDLVCRWNLHRGLRYTQARDLWQPFDRIQAADLPTRQTLARVVRATLDAGHHAFITINNKAEGSAPLSVLELALALLADEAK